MIFMIAAAAIAALYLFSIFPRTSQKHRILKNKISLFAHRGYHDIGHSVPENSMPAFHAAVHRGYGIELDLHLTKDGEIVVFHDDTLERLCGCSKVVEQSTYDELRQFCLSGTSERIPLFREVLTAVNGRVPLLIELKIPGRSLRICRKTLELLKDYRGTYMIQSFNTLGLLWFRFFAPHILRGQLASHLTAEDTKEAWILKFFVQNLLCNFIGRPDFISYKFSDLPHASVLLLQYVLRVPVAVWTLGTSEALRKGLTAYQMQIFEKHGENY